MIDRRGLIAGVGASLAAPAWLAGCATSPASTSRGAPRSADSADLALLNRVTWGVDGAVLAEFGRGSRRDYLDAQLRAERGDRLPPDVQAQIDALPLRQKTTLAWAAEMDQRRRDADATANDDAKKVAQQAWPRVTHH
ncbi:MAG TPA: hypothetical protein VNU71_02765 [Burkholderiaceae bacterium]|nr:hypothetical protein [Burkholderiaceae bacterium]